MSIIEGPDDWVALEETKVNYAWDCAVAEIERQRRAPWWWGLAMVLGLAWLALAAWTVFRTVAGWPVESSWLQRIAG